MKAVDTLPQAIISAQRKSIDGIDFICQDAIEYLEKIEDQSVSVIVANHILQHISPSTRIQEFFKQVKRTMNNGGLFFAAYFVGPADTHPVYVQKYAFYQTPVIYQTGFFPVIVSKLLIK